MRLSKFDRFETKPSSGARHTDRPPITRHAVLKSHVSLYCATCRSVQRVLDLFPNGEALLGCSHRRKP